MVRSYRKIKHPRSEKVYRSAVHHFNLIKSGMADGISSSTNLYDDSEFSYDNLKTESKDSHLNPFSIHLDKMDLADRLQHDRTIGKAQTDVSLSNGAPNPVADIVQSPE